MGLRHDDTAPSTPGGWTPDAAQADVLALPLSASALVVGAPGAGKTQTLVARVRALVDAGVDPDDIRVLTPTRPTATALRDRLALAVDRATAGPLARSVASYAFAVVRAAEVRAGAPAPQLLTGADEDQIVQEILALDADDDAEGRSRWPAAVGADIRATRGFRDEVRTFLAECAALGIVPERLDELARAVDVPVWASLAGFARDYGRLRSALRGAHRDAAGLLREALSIVRAAPAGTDVVGARVLVVDDAQELTRGGVELVRACRDRGTAVLAFGDPDIGSGSFRGASTENLVLLSQVLGDTRVLDGSHRASASIVDLVSRVTARIGVAGVVAHRRRPTGEDPGDAVRAFTLRSPAEEYDVIARLLRERHVHDGIAWSACAVLAHDTRQVAALEAELAAREVPTRAVGPVRALGAARPVRDLLGILDLAIRDPATWTPDEVRDALLGAYGGLDPVELRRLRTALRHRELAAGGERAGGDLLCSALRQPLEFELVDTREGRAGARLARAVAAVAAAHAERASAHELLWAAWESTGRQRVWAEAARGSGPLADQAGRDLDAVVALFQAAKRFGERQSDTSSSAEAFLVGIRASDVAEDRLDAPVAVDAVRVLTPAGAVGTEFDTVIVAGVQDGVWPNTRLRGGLLETWRLADAGEGAAAPAVLDRRRGVLHDELRLFARAVSRARARVVVTAVDDDDLGPSALFELLPDAEPAPAAAAHPLSLRGLVARHRRALTDPRANAAERRAAPGQLVLLAAAGIAGADPDAWYGVAPPTSTAPLRDLEREDVRVSPSRLHTLEECELNWVIGDLGGDTGGTTAGIGTIIHAALEQADGVDEEALWRIVEERWGELDFEAGWRDRAEKTRARDLVRRLHLYLRDFAAAGGELVGAEPHFEVRIPLDDTPRTGHAAVLSGYIDRVERTADGRIVIVDLKTGKREPQTDAKVADNPQLAAYQLAHEAGMIPEVAGDPPGGAKLLVLRPTAASKDYVTPTQQPFDDDGRTAFLARIDGAVAVMRGVRFDAPYEEHCRDEYSYGLCRIHTVSAVSAS